MDLDTGFFVAELPFVWLFFVAPLLVEEPDFVELPDLDAADLDAPDPLAEVFFDPPEEAGRAPDFEDADFDVPLFDVLPLAEPFFAADGFEPPEAERLPEELLPVVPVGRFSLLSLMLFSFLSSSLI